LARDSLAVVIAYATTEVAPRRLRSGPYSEWAEELGVAVEGEYRWNLFRRVQAMGRNSNPTG
jgi:hypothetical protein